jgi:uncharacterized membrane protein YphA (DoxX/SURF4 family)
MDRASYANLALRLGLALAFLYPPINALSDPNSWIGYFPPFVLSLSHAAGVPDLVLLHSFGALEVIIALWILSGWRIQLPAALACAMLVGIVIFNWPQFTVLFRDLSIAAIAFSLALTSQHV